MANKDLLHSTGNCIPHTVINHNGKEYENEATLFRLTNKAQKNTWFLPCRVGGLQQKQPPAFSAASVNSDQNSARVCWWALSDPALIFPWLEKTWVNVLWAGGHMAGLRSKGQRCSGLCAHMEQSWCISAGLSRLTLARNPVKAGHGYSERQTQHKSHGRHVLALTASHADSPARSGLLRSVMLAFPAYSLVSQLYRKAGRWHTARVFW